MIKDYLKITGRSLVGNGSNTIILFFLCSIFSAYSQPTKRYNLAKLQIENKLEPTMDNQHIQALDSPKNQGLSVKGIVWLKGVTFKEGVVDVDLKAKNVLDQSFVGIAFYGIDTNNYSVVYFRPFNFHIADTLRRQHAVQYECFPDYSWDKLRMKHPLIYEHPVNPVPEADKWFHATIVVKKDSITVYVNRARTASLNVKKLDNSNGGKIGLWTFSDGVSGDFANLTITE
jgi:hypothetical protein